MVGFLGFGRGRNAGDISEAEVAALRLLGPHMRRAAMINNLIELKAVEASTFVSVLDALAAGVVLVDDSLAIVHANGTARDMLGTNDPIVLRRGRIELSHRGAHEALAAAVWQAAQDEAGLGQRGIGIPAPYRDGSPCVVHVLPLRQGTIRPDLMRRAAAALFVAPSSLSPQFPSNALAVLYDLTPAEARVLELLCDGRTQTEIAAHLGIAASTVKTHLQHVFDKTGCRRQVELVKLAGSLAFP
jgi:DNA-binding CsgD family transcriptional regulator